MDTIKQGWRQWLHWCKNIENEKMLDTLFDLLLTPEEKKDIATRCLIVKELLTQTHSQRDIAKHLNVSIAKITRGSNELKRIKDTLIQYIRDNQLK